MGMTAGGVPIGSKTSDYYRTKDIPARFNEPGNNETLKFHMRLTKAEAMNSLCESWSVVTYLCDGTISVCYESTVCPAILDSDNYLR